MPTTTYNVYRVYLNQASGVQHEGIALVPAQNENQGAGRFYHVIGTVGLGMDYQKRPAYRFTEDKSFHSTSYQFQIAAADLSKFEAVAEKQPPPHDPRALTERNPDPPVRNCADWVNDVLREAEGLLKQ